MFIEVDLSNLVINVGQCLNQQCSLLFNEVNQISWDFISSQDFTLRAFVVHSNSINDVHGTFQLGFSTDWDLNGSSRGSEFSIDLLNGLERISTHSIHLVDECDSWNVITTHLTVHGDSLGLDTRHSTDNQDSTIQDSKSSFDFNGEIDVTWCINQVKMVRLVVSLPRTVGSSRLNGDTFFPFKIHRVHLGTNVITASHLMDGLDSTRVEKHTLSECGLTRVNVGRDTDVSHQRRLLQVIFRQLLEDLVNDNLFLLVGTNSS